MCGIIGIASNKPSVDKLVIGLLRQEYRGYDSAGLAIFGGGIFVINDNMTAGQLMSFLVSLMLAYAPLKSLINVNVLLQSGLGAASRIFDFIDMKNDIIGGTKIVKKFEKVVFKKGHHTIFH